MKSLGQKLRIIIVSIILSNQILLIVLEISIAFIRLAFSSYFLFLEHDIEEKFQFNLTRQIIHFT